MRLTSLRGVPIIFDMESLKILIADDDCLVRQTVRAILSSKYDPANFGEAENGEQAVKAITGDAWDLIVLDLSMPLRNGLDILREAADRQTAAPVLVLSAKPEEQAAVDAIRNGAAGFLSKARCFADLLTAIESVLAGNRWISDSVAAALESEEVAGDTQLSSREAAVLNLIAEGHSVKQVAHTLNLSEKSVRTYRARMFKKLGFKTDADVVRYALSKGLLNF